MCFCRACSLTLVLLRSPGAPPLSSLEKEKDIDFDLLQDLMDVDIDPLDIDLEKDPLAAKVFKVGFDDDVVSFFWLNCVFFHAARLPLYSPPNHQSVLSFHQWPS